MLQLKGATLKTMFYKRKLEYAVKLKGDGASEEFTKCSEVCMKRQLAFAGTEDIIFSSTRS